MEWSRWWAWGLFSKFCQQCNVMTKCLAILSQSLVVQGHRFNQILEIRLEIIEWPFLPFRIGFMDLFWIRFSSNSSSNDTVPKKELSLAAFPLLFLLLWLLCWGWGKLRAVPFLPMLFWLSIVDAALVGCSRVTITFAGGALLWWLGCRGCSGGELRAVPFLPFIFWLSMVDAALAGYSRVTITFAGGTLLWGCSGNGSSCSASGTGSVLSIYALPLIHPLSMVDAAREGGAGVTSGSTGAALLWLVGLRCTLLGHVAVWRL